MQEKGELTHRKKLFFKEATTSLHGTIDSITAQTATLKSKPRFLIVTDYKTLLAYDTKTTDTLDIKFSDLAKHYDFFLPLAGMEKLTVIDENPADVKASNQLAKLYDEILKNNPTKNQDEVHALNVFLTRLLFCYFAEDSNIFDYNVFTNSISNHTQADGSDVSSYIERLFEVFNTDNKDREVNLPEYLSAFPYVNGGLFKDKHPVPTFTAKSRNIMIDIGGLDWSAINPDIFGSMIQAVVTQEDRGNMGMHYTSVPNIMKVMQPLFLDELYEEFDKSRKSKKKLQGLIDRISNLKIFDPACGSGNFLIIAYKELRQLEMQILTAIDDLSQQTSFAFSEIRLTQFYGIELDDFAHEVAILSLWLIEHQMNLEFFKAFGRTTPSLPLQSGGNIVHGNATRVDWGSVCPKNTGDEIYILGNPPYLGSRNQNKEQKEDMKLVNPKFARIDYIALWFLKASHFMENTDNVSCSLVSTNSIIQGEQVALLWPTIINELNIELGFAHKSFLWRNNAQKNAGITVVIIGLRNVSKSKKYLFFNNLKSEVSNINAYLIPTKNIFITKLNKPLSNFPVISLGSAAYDGGFLMFTLDEKNKIIDETPKANILFKRFIGSVEFVRGIERYCLWVENKDVEFAQTIKKINDRLESVKKFRLLSKRKQTHETASIPHRFTEDRHIEKTLSLFLLSHQNEEII